MEPCARGAVLNLDSEEEKIREGRFIVVPECHRLYRIISPVAYCANTLRRSTAEWKAL